MELRQVVQVSGIGHPVIVEIPGLPASHELQPLAIVRGYQRSRRDGWIRDQVEQTRRDITGRVARYVGEVFRKRVDEPWQLCDDPQNGDFGEMRIRSFAPGSVVKNFALRRQSGLLKQATSSVLARIA